MTRPGRTFRMNHLGTELLLAFIVRQTVLTSPVSSRINAHIAKKTCRFEVS